MKLTTEQKQEIQTFTYFLFRGHLDPRLINTTFNYLDKLLNDPILLYNCFQIFAYAVQTSGLTSNFLISDNSTDKKQLSGVNDKLVADYILYLHVNTDEQTANGLVDEAIEFNKRQINLWTDYLTLAKCFCFNTFPDSVNHNYIPGLHGNGSDAVPTFAVWTNVIEIDDHLIPLNSDAAFKRANERIKLWDGQKPIKEFEDWELEQELY